MDLFICFRYDSIELDDGMLMFWKGLTQVTLDAPTVIPTVLLKY
jgi:hypothetical protein